MMKQILVKFATAFLNRQGYIVKPKAEYQLVPDFILRMQAKQIKPLEPYDWAEEGETK
ncbi:hypothetical protein NUS45_03730 [Glaesserella parasuis]|nr:hypothetical protein [Glaesserella parasuis]MCT8565333.1 hypothetical protein [Glaesserella parasuis]MCT8813151.1 hypothetical protein [Glaesserella parasuis]MCT8844867.1 hypothetical protein [Glaesserella parasuis]MCU1098249.1 hypothetical protein [Glaesserella parasuis]